MTTPIFGSPLIAQARADLGRSRAEHLLHDPGSNEAKGDDNRIEKGAKEFEAILLGSWLQQAEQSMATVPGANDEQEGSGSEQMVSLGVQSLSTALAASGGIGIAGMIEKAMRAEAHKGDSIDPPKKQIQDFSKSSARD